MSKSNWKLRWRRPSKLGWVVRVGVLCLALFIWFNSARTLAGGSAVWGRELVPIVVGGQQRLQDNGRPWMFFTWNHFCLNLNGATASLPFGMPLRYADYVSTEGVDIPDTWQFFRYGFVVPVWSISLFAFALVVLTWRPRIFRPRPGCCSKCNYSLCGIPSSNACPECGMRLPSP